MLKFSCGFICCYAFVRLYSVLISVPYNPATGLPFMWDMDQIMFWCLFYVLMSGSCLIVAFTPNS